MVAFRWLSLSLNLVSKRRPNGLWMLCYTQDLVNSLYNLLLMFPELTQYLGNSQAMRHCIEQFQVYCKNFHCLADHTWCLHNPKSYKVLHYTKSWQSFSRQQVDRAYFSCFLRACISLHAITFLRNKMPYSVLKTSKTLTV